MIKKTLICLNEDLKFLENYFQNDFFKKNPKIVCEFIYDKAAFDGKKRAIENNAYDAIVNSPGRGIPLPSCGVLSWYSKKSA